MDDVTESTEDSPRETLDNSQIEENFDSNGKQRRMLGHRHAIHLWLFATCLFSYNMRSIMNIAIVSMVGNGLQTNSSSLTDDVDLRNLSNTAGTCPYPADQREEIILEYSKGEFDWSHATQGFILSSFYYSYVTTQVLGGYIVRHTGGRLLMAISLGGSAVCVLLHPPAARLGPGYLAFLRILHGFMDSFSFPVGHYLISRWAPKHERTILASMAWSGCNIGIMISTFSTGFLCEYGFAGGWPSAFYVFGCLGLACTIGWFICVRDSPAHHPSIRETERMYIEQHNEPINDKEVPFTKIPWFKFATSGPFWAIAIAHFCGNWAYYTPFVEVPTYLKEILHMKPSWTGIITSIPYILQFVMANLSAFLSDILIAKGLPVAFVRKFCYGSGAIVCAACLVLITYVGCDTPAVVILLCTGIGIWGFVQSGFFVNYFDIAPQYASIMFAITNSLGAIPAFVVPLLTGYMTNEESSIHTWSNVFLLSAVIPVIGVIAFSLLGSGELQPWAITNSKPQREEIPKTSQVTPLTSDC